MRDPYSLLGVSSSASDDEIKKAYRVLAKKYHPDVNKNAGAEDKFIEIQNAYESIMDARKRGDSSNFWQQGSNSGYGGNSGAGFGGFGGNAYSSSSNEYQNIVQYLNARRYSEAYQLLQQIQDRGADWYYLSAMAQYGMGNQIAAMELAEKACQMDPSNQQYRQLYAQMQSGRSRYQNMQQPFSMGGSDLCCRLMMISFCCNGCCGGRVFCC